MEQFFKVLITTSGNGSRLGAVTQFVNKALVRVGKKAAISYIIDNIPLEVPIVITLGYKKEQVKEYLFFAHPDRIFEFVEVNPYEGEGASQAYSVLCAKSHVRCPFIYIACDTVFSMPLTYPAENWIGGEKHPDSEQYTSMLINPFGIVMQLQPKGAPQYDYVYIGCAGIHDFDAFWQQLEQLYVENRNNKCLNDVLAFARMIKNGFKFNHKRMENWLDIGNETALRSARNQTKDFFDNLEKLDESIYLFDSRFVIKFFSDSSIIQKRIARSRQLRALVPKIEMEGKFFYRYSYVKGELYSHFVNPSNLHDFLHWCQTSLWRPMYLNCQEKKQFIHHCYNFYYKKTMIRVEQFYSLLNIKDEPHTINFENTPSLEEMFSAIDWNFLCNGKAGGFHGDLHFENILLVGENYCLLDWRQDFDGLIEYGDIYYDLAKLNHGMIISHDIIRKNLFKIETKDKKIFCEILRPDNLVLCQEQFYLFLENHSLDRKRVDILTALIFLNIAPLHHYPYNLFLYFFGKLRLLHALCINKKFTSPSINQFFHKT